MALWIVGGVCALEARADSPENDPKEYAFVASGGISRGAYEAGVTYLTLEDIMWDKANRPSPGKKGLTVATGASAGNINVFLAAITLLQDEKEMPARGVPLDTLTSNLFWDTWIDVGWDKLSPVENERADGKALFTATEGVLTRAAFDDAVARLTGRMAAPVYLCGRELVLGITLTRETSYDLAAGGGASGTALTAPAQRYVVPFKAKVACGDNGHGKLILENYGTTDQAWSGATNAKLGRIFRFEERGKDGIPPLTLITAIKAASAFPIAFGPLRLTNFADGPPAGPPERYFDGGLFDNVPLSLAMELADTLVRERTPGAAAAAAAGVRYYFVDSGVRRAEPPPRARGAGPNGLAYTVSVLGRFIGESRNYELQSSARFESERAKEIRTTSRYYPIVGDFMGGFGAFLHRDFRRYDYFVGAYDYLFLAAQREYEVGRRYGAYPGSVGEWNSFLDAFKVVADRLVEGTPDRRRFQCPPDAAPRSLGRALVQEMLKYELAWRAPGVVVPVCPRPNEDDRVWTVFDKLQELDRSRRDQVALGTSADVGFRAFLDALPEPFQEDVVFQVTGRYVPGQAGLDDLYHSMLDRVARRAIDIERVDQKAATDELSPGAYLQVGRYALNTVMPRTRGRLELDFDPSTVTRAGGAWWSPFHLLPYYLKGQPAGCGIEVGWEPRVRIKSFFLYGGAGPRLKTCQRDGSKWEARLAPGLGWEFGSWVDLMLGFTFTRPLAGPYQAWHFGPEITVDVVHKLRFGVGLPRLFRDGALHTEGLSSKWGWADNLSFSVGVTDLNGIFYWLTGFGRCLYGCEEPEDQPVKEQAQDDSVKKGKS